MMHIGIDRKPLEPLEATMGVKSVPLMIVNATTKENLGFTPESEMLHTPYDKQKHAAKLKAAGIPTLLYVAQSGDELMETINAEVECMETTPLTDEGRKLLAYWLNNAPVIAYKRLGPTDAERYWGIISDEKWKTPEYSTIILSALHHALTCCIAHDADMCKAMNALIPDGKEVFFDEPSGALTWWQTKLMRLQDIGYSVGSRLPKVKVPAGYRTSNFIYNLLNSPIDPQSELSKKDSGPNKNTIIEEKPSELSQKGDNRDGRTEGKFSVIKWGESLKYPIEDKMEIFTITSKKCWIDIDMLMNEKGNYIKVLKGFTGRFRSPDASRLKKYAFDPEGKGKNGTGRYRLLI